MGDKITPHPSDCATCSPGSPALPHAASNAAISEQFRRLVAEGRAAAERERIDERGVLSVVGEALLSALDERDVARAKLAEVARERDEARSTLDAMSVSLRDRLAEAERERDEARAAYYEARTGRRVSERLRGQAEGEVARLRCFAEGLAQGLSVPAAGASSGLCRVCLTARPPLAEVATVTTRGASGELLHFCDECWGLTAARHSGVAR